MNKNEQQKELDKKREMATQVGRLLPETIEKVEHYKGILKAESSLLDVLQARQSKWFVSTINKARELVEMSKVTNSIINKQKVFESYLARKTKYEKWLEEMAQEVQPNFKKVLGEAKEITSNMRLVNAISKWEERTETPTLREKVEFYLYLQQEMLNKKKFKR